MQASIEDVSTDTEEWQQGKEEWQQYKPEDFGPAPVTGSNPEADYEAALAASLADVTPLGPPPTSYGAPLLSGVSSTLINRHLPTVHAHC